MSSEEPSLESQSADQLLALLRRVQGRLGTSKEQSGDLGLAQMIGHELNNLKTEELLRLDLKQAS